jgi:S-(hydroxymethyl)glutathione dehydrogenase/alcohol dehydrogenase
VKAAVCYEYGKPLVIEDVDLDPPQKGEVKIRLAATAICHSDINIISGAWGEFVPVPLVPGHESAGYVEEVGEDVTSVKPGDTVIAGALVSCGRCQSCVSGLPHLCEAMWPLDAQENSRLHNKQGQRLTRSRVSGFAEYAVVYESQVAKIPKDVPMDSASLLSCGVITGFGAVVNRAQVKPLSSVVIVGIGGVGLNSVQGAAFAGAYPVIAVDLLDNKLEAAKAFGATHTVNAKKTDAIKAVRELTSGRGADYAFVTGGGAAALSLGYAMLGRRGTVVLVTMMALKDTYPFPPSTDFVPMEKSFVACWMGATRFSVDIPRLVALYQAGRLKLDELISGRYPLEQINEAIESVEKGEALRHVIVF